MVSLFLVEDEMLSRESIKKNVPWTENGIDFLGDAPDGEMALPQILEKKPDIVLTDIKMPFMDGLELSQLIRDKLPETRIIILSGYNEFDYARQAISLGISEYLLKPVAVEDILAAVEKVRGNIERTRQAQQEKSAQEQARREIFFSSLYSGFLSGTGEILNRAESLSLPIAASLYRVVVADFDPPFDGEGEKWKTLLYQTPDALASGFNGRQVAYLLCVENEQVLAARENRLKNWLEEFCARYEMRVNLLKGDTVRRLSDLDKSYQTANLRRGSSRSSVPNKSLIGAKPLASGELLEFLRSGKAVSARLFWEYYRTEMEGALHSYIYRCYLMTELFFAIRKFVDEIGTTIPQVLTDSEVLERWIATDCTVDEFITFAGDLCEQVMHERGERGGNRYVSVAEAVNVSPNHLSTVFKEKNGVGFSEFVTEVRIRQAKRLLVTTELRASDIGERVGYQNMNYFSMLFKKMTGTSPSQYRREHKA